MAIALGDNIGITGPLPTDSRYFSTLTNKTWASCTEVTDELAGGVGGVRYTGLTVNIAGTEYWFRDGIEDVDLIEKVNGAGTFLPYTMAEDVQDPTGFINNDNIQVTYNTDRTITLSATTGSLEFYFDGTKYSLGTSWTSAAHADTSAAYFLYSTGGTNIEWSTTVWDLRYLMVAARPADTPYAIREIHGTMPWQAHREFHQTIGTYRESGFGFTDGTYDLQPVVPVDSGNTIGFEAGVIKDEDISTSLDAWIKGTYTHLHFTGASSHFFQTGETTVFQPGSTYPKIFPYDGSGFTETEMSSGEYANWYVLRIPVTSDAVSQQYRAAVVQPQFKYSTLEAAQAESPLNLYFGDITTIAPEYVLVERITFSTDSGYSTTGKVRIEALSILTGTRLSQVNTVAGLGSVTAGNVSVAPQSPYVQTNLQALTSCYATDIQTALSGGGGTLNMSGNTVGGITTYVDATTICAQSEIQYDGTNLILTGNSISGIYICGDGGKFLQIGDGATGNYYALIDLIGDATYNDYGVRLIRNNSGPNSDSTIFHRGTGDLGLYACEAGRVVISTNDTEAVVIDSGHTMCVVGQEEIISTGAIYSGVPSLTVTDTTTRGTILLESQTDNPTDFFMKVGGNLTWDFSARNEASNHTLALYSSTNGTSWAANPVLQILTGGTFLLQSSTGNNSIYAIENSNVTLYNAGAAKLGTRSDGACTTGIHCATTCLKAPIVQLTTGAADGCVLTSNAAGCGVWSTPSGGGGIAMSGSTVGGLTTYVDANTICAQPNITFDGSNLEFTKGATRRIQIGAVTTDVAADTLFINGQCRTGFGANAIAGALCLFGGCALRSGSPACGGGLSLVGGNATSVSLSCAGSVAICGGDGTTTSIGSGIGGNVFIQGGIGNGLGGTSICGCVVLGFGSTTKLTTQTGGVCVEGVHCATTCHLSPIMCGTSCIKGGTVCSTGNMYATDGDILAGTTSKTSDTVIRVMAADAYKTGFEAYGSSQGTGYVCVGQSATYGGGMYYNGDGSPPFASGGTADRTSFYRTCLGTNCVIFGYGITDSTVWFEGTTCAPTICSTGDICSTGRLYSSGLNTTSTIVSTYSAGSGRAMTIAAGVWYAACDNLGNSVRLLGMESAAQRVIFGPVEGNSEVRMYVGGAARHCFCTTGEVDIGGILCSTTCVRAPIFCATTNYCTTGAGYRYYGGTGCGTAVDWVATSDCRIKDNLVPISNALSTVDCLCGWCYNFCEDGTPDMGLIAQEVEVVEPRLVSKGEVIEEYKKYGIEDEVLSLKYDKMAGLFVEAIKELKQQNICLQNQINELRKNK